MDESEGMTLLARVKVDSSDSDGHVISDLNIALIVITSVLVIVRLYVRGIVVRGLGWDDLFALLAWVSLVAYIPTCNTGNWTASTDDGILQGNVTALSCVEVILVTKGVGTHMDKVHKAALVEMFSLMPVDKMLFISSGCFVRLSIVLCLPRIYRARSFMTFIYGASMATIIVSATSLLFLVFSCSPPADVFNAGKPDRQCVSNFTLGRMRQAHSIATTIINIFIMGLTIKAVSTTQRTRAKTVKRLLILILGVFVIVSTFVRVAMLMTTDLSVDTTYKMLRTQAWFPVEVHVGLWCSCLLALEPLVDPGSNPRNYNHYNMRKLSKSSAWDPQDDIWQRDLMTANSKVLIHGEPRDPKGKRKASNADSEVDVDMFENERGIKLTTEFSVHVESSDRPNREGLEERVARTPAWNAF
ncbi:unnamed protein product [Fusarium graminearum]|nr:hypothetical protein HG531_008021 [Fusarium graminearum]CAG1968135.1 unnamed protein product [Fusarium graminearum]CAG1993866.1 unnamed protein product [Fusarium graminearum]VTO82256.1 unnamed protein product [Fusarium graminearum]